MLSTICAVCCSKKGRLIKIHEANGLLLGPNSPFSIIPLLVSSLLTTKKEFKDLKKQEIQGIFIKITK